MAGWSGCPTRDFYRSGGSSMEWVGTRSLERRGESTRQPAKLPHSIRLRPQHGKLEVVFRWPRWLRCASHGKREVCLELEVSVSAVEPRRIVISWPSANH